MRFTNKFNLPEALVRAAEKAEYNSTSYSPSSIASPPQQYILKKRHYDELVDDVNNRAWMMLGRAVHKIFEEGGGVTDLVEEKIRVKLPNGHIFSGVPDVYIGSEKKIIDYKTITTSMKGKPERIKEYEFQLNCYAYLMERCGFDVNELWVLGLMRDWSVRTAYYNKSYPSSPYWYFKVNKYEIEYIEELIVDRVNRMYVAEFDSNGNEIDDCDLLECTEEEMWASKAGYAVMKKGAKKASKICDSEDQANAYIKAAKGEFKIEERKSLRTRCEFYCSVKDVCQQYKRYKEGK